MKPVVLAVGCMTAIALTAMGQGRAQAKSCTELLSSESYRCLVRSSFQTEFEDCLRFTTPGAVSQNFDLAVQELEETLGCACRTRGSFRRPRFGTATDFHCVTPPEAANAASFAGKVAAKGRRLKKIQAVTSTGDTFVLECILDPTCDVGGALRTAPGPAIPYAR
jgi:hypothetical protein